MNFWKETIKNGHLCLTCDLEITSWFSESVYAATLFVESSLPAQSLCAFLLESPEEMLWSYTPLCLTNLVNKLEGSELTGLGPADKGGRWGAIQSHNTDSTWWGRLSLRQTEALGAGALCGVCWAWEWLKTAGCGSSLTMIEWQLSYIMSATDGLMPEHSLKQEVQQCSEKTLVWEISIHQNHIVSGTYNVLWVCCQMTWDLWNTL